MTTIVTEPNTPLVTIRPVVPVGSEMYVSAEIGLHYSDLRKLADDHFMALLINYEKWVEDDLELIPEEVYALVVDSRVIAERIVSIVHEWNKIIGKGTTTIQITVYAPIANAHPIHVAAPTIGYLWDMLATEQGQEPLKISVNGHVITESITLTPGDQVDIITWQIPTFTLVERTVAARALLWVPVSARRAGILLSQPGSYLVNRNGDPVGIDDEEDIYLILEREEYLLNLMHLIAIANAYEPRVKRDEFMLYIGVQHAKEPRTLHLIERPWLNDLWTYIDDTVVYTKVNGEVAKNCAAIPVGAIVSILTFTQHKFYH